jgi:sortase A
LENNQKDLTKASNWFKNSNFKVDLSQVTIYQISIPKVKINKAFVSIGNDDLTKSLIQYAKGANPGKLGNTVIFGHSVLPQFFDPSNYLTIFSLLPELKINDDIFVRYDGMDYRYKIIAKKITEPEDISGLEQKFDSSYLTLVTCVPPGTYFKRLWVTAKQTSFSEH